MNTQNGPKPVPGSYGLPILGRIAATLKFVKGWPTYLKEQGRRLQSTVFRNAGGIDAIAVIDRKGMEVVLDLNKVSKLYGFGPLRPPPARIGHIVPTVFANDEKHTQLKQWLLEIQKERAPHVFRTFDEVSTPYFERWVKQGRFDLGQGLGELVADLLFQWLLGKSLDVHTLEAWSVGILPLGLFRFPGSGDKPVVEQLQRLLAEIGATPRWAEISKKGRELAGLQDDEARKQFLFAIGFNGWGSMQGAARSAIAELSLNPAYMQRAVEQVDQAASAVGYKGGPMTMELLTATPLIRNLIRETLRLHQPAGLIYGKTREDLVIEAKSGSYAVKKGEVLRGAIGCVHRDPDTFENPERFDPDRFNDPAVVDGLLWSAGRESCPVQATDRTCAGRDVAYLIQHMLLFKVLLGHRWALKEKPVWHDDKYQPGNRPFTPLICTSFEAR